MMLNRFEAVGLPLGPKIRMRTAKRTVDRVWAGRLGYVSLLAA